MLKYDCLRDSATTLLPTKLHGSDKRCRHGRQQMINLDNCRYENFGNKLCFNFNVVVVSDGEKTKWKTIIMPMYNYACTLCKISTIVHCYDLHLREYQLIYIIRTWTSWLSLAARIYLELDNCFAALKWAYIIYNQFLYQLSQIRKNLSICYTNVKILEIK